MAEKSDGIPIRLTRRREAAAAPVTEGEENSSASSAAPRVDHWPGLGLALACPSVPSLGRLSFQSSDSLQKAIQGRTKVEPPEGGTTNDGHPIRWPKVGRATAQRPTFNAERLSRGPNGALTWGVYGQSETRRYFPEQAQGDQPDPSQKDPGRPRLCPPYRRGIYLPLGGRIFSYLGPMTLLVNSSCCLRATMTSSNLANLTMART